MKCSNRPLMASFVRTLLLAALLPCGVVAQQRADPALLPAALRERVALVVADLWDVRADRLRLEWGIVRQGHSLSEETVFRIVGRGTDGWFAVLFERDGGGPLAARLRVASLDSVPVASRPLTAGATLVEGDIARAERSRWGPPAGHATWNPTPGWRVRRAIAAGESLAAPKIAPPLMVRAGESVQLIWNRGGIRVAVEGIAVNAAALGEEVRVRLADRRGKARGIVTGPRTADLVGSITR